jgi:hypothetical protein
MRLPQFTLARIFLAIFWFAICFAAWRIQPPLWTDTGTSQLCIALVFFSFRVFPIPTAIGSLFGYTLRGFIVGIAAYFCWLGLLLFALATIPPGTPFP